VGALVRACGLALAGQCGLAWSQAVAPAEAAASQAATAPPVASSQGVNRPLAFSVNATAAATSNGGLDDSGRRQNDFITSVRPELVFARAAPGFTADVRAAATFLDYANGSQPNGVLPDARGAFKSTLVDRWLHLDASAYARAAEADPFGVRTDDVLGANRLVESGFVIGPTLQHDFGPELSVLAREQFARIHNDAAEGARLSSELSEIRIERKPTPLGVSADVTRLENRATDEGGSHYTLTTARLRGVLMLGGELEVGAIAGRDGSDYLLSRHSDPLYGGFFDWAPGPRTRLEFELEHRYFGQSGKLQFDHRTPFLTISVALQREPVDAVSSFATLGQGTDLASALNSILTTRYPDPAVRAGIVDGIITSRGLDPRTAGAVNILGDYPQWQTAAQGALTLLGAVDTLSLSAYSLTTRALTRDGDPLAGLGAAVADTRQRGAALQFEHRLGPQVSVALAATWSRIEGLSASASDLSTEQTWRASVLRHLSPRSDLTVAIQWYRFTTNVVGRPSFDATLGLVGLNHRF
jgi:uncharacterized protein (PEP-CTERM system associated)